MDSLPGMKTMKYTVGDLIDENNAGLGYIANIKKCNINRNIICIVWFSDYAEYAYSDLYVDNWISNKTARHYSSET